MAGVVRKIDELGRIVIPKEIRKFLGLDSGSSVNIETTNNGITLTKFLPMQHLKEYVDCVVDTLCEQTGLSVVVVDEDVVIAVGGLSKQLINKPIVSKLKHVADKSMLVGENVIDIVDMQNFKAMSMYITVIKDQIKSIGKIILLDKTNLAISNKDCELACCMARYLSKLIEK